MFSKVKKKKKGKEEKKDLIHQLNSSSPSSLWGWEVGAVSWVTALAQDCSPASHPGADHPESEGERKGEEEERGRRRRRDGGREGRPLRGHGVEGMARVSGRQARTHP